MELMRAKIEVVNSTIVRNSQGASSTEATAKATSFGASLQGNPSLVTEAGGLRRCLRAARALAVAHDGRIHNLDLCPHELHGAVKRCLSICFSPGSCFAARRGGRGGVAVARAKPLPVTLRIGFATCVATLLYGIVPHASLAGAGWDRLAFAAGGEVLIGLAMGFVGSLIFARSRDGGTHYRHRDRARRRPGL